ncbi:MAG: recombinase family protein [Lachnospiraceae bacterium]|nr:recombinase family protein [Lachnospiraceae bacterium]
MNISAYTRISVDIEQDRDNTSIENQKKIISDYISEHFPAAQVTFYADRDRSGYTFAQREDYMRMRPKLLDGESTVLIVKDFSRFSRRNSLGLLELELLRDAGVRIISIGDNIDYPTRDDWMLIQFKFLMNEFPVTDTSKKIKAIIKNRQKSGQWVCSVPYGYRITNTKEMTYEIDPAAAEVVREIFDLYNSGWGYKKIANYLTDKGVPTPRANEIAWRESMGQKTRLTAKSEWSIASVYGILPNDFYIGTLRQGKYSRKGINGVDQRVDDTDHIVIENAHTPIIDTKTFLFAQEQLRQRSTNNYRGEKKYATDYSGYLFCGDCGSPMFSMSRPDLKAAYVCGTYHRRGRSGCTSHHVHVERLDELLKRYVSVVRDNSADMLTELEEALRRQPDHEEQIGLAIENIERQLSDAKAQLKNLLKRKLIDTMGKDPDAAAIIDETYMELEQELTHRIKGLERQIDDNIDHRNRLLQTNRAAKTVLDVFDSILQKPHLDKRDIGLIVERITVYEGTDPEQNARIDIQLKADIDGLLQNGLKVVDNGNFNSDIENILNSPIVQRATHQKDKVFDVNVISEGDPLEIYTERDGEVIFKKYSPMGDLTDLAVQICESIAKNTGHIAVVSDRDSIIAVAGAPKRDLMDKRNSQELEQLMEQRKTYRYQSGNSRIRVSDNVEKYHLGVATPILTEGDLMGCVILLLEESDMPLTEQEQKLAQTVAGFLGRQLEN